MAWGVPDMPEWRRRVSERPHWKLPLSRALLSDPAFSSDPRAHPHFAAHLSPRPSAPPKDVPPPPPSPPPAATRPKLIPDPRKATAPARGPSRQAPPRNNNVPRKASMRALIRRLASHHNLDRIDELDETDPFGGSYHHDGPYEAISGDHVCPIMPCVYDGPAPRRGNIPHSKREFGLCSLHPPQRHSPPRVPYFHGGKGLSLHLEPGQILQHNTIYASHISSITSFPIRSRRQSSTFATVAQPDHFQSHSLPSPPTRSPGDTVHRPSSLPHTPLQRHLGDHTPGLPAVLPHRRDLDATPHTPLQAEMTTLPPPQHESRSHISGSALSSFKRTSLRATETTVPALPPHDPRDKSVYSSESPYPINATTARSSSSIPKKSLDLPHHLPRRLVMPAPLQPQTPQPQHRFPPAEPVAWQDEYTVDGMKLEGHSATDTQGSKLLRKKSPAFSEKPSVPRHVSDGAVPTTSNTLTSDADGTKDKTRRRRLSKRRNDT